MPKAYDSRRWSSGLRFDDYNLPHYDELRTITVRERDVSSSADNRNSLYAIIGDMQVSTATAAEIAAEPSRVNGSLIDTNSPHPDGILAGMGVKCRGFVNPRVLNQWEAEITAVYSIPYPLNVWGAGIIGQPAMTTRDETEWIEIPTIYVVNRAGGGTGREKEGVRRIERTTIYTTLSTTITVGNYGALGAYVGDTYAAANRIQAEPVVGTDERTKNSIIRGAFLDPDPQTAALSGGSGRWSYVVQYRWKAPIIALPGIGNRIDIPEVPANGEITTALDVNGQPIYKVFLPTENYATLTPPP